MRPPHARPLLLVPLLIFFTACPKSGNQPPAGGSQNDTGSESQDTQVWSTDASGSPIYGLTAFDDSDSDVVLDNIDPGTASSLPVDASVLNATESSSRDFPAAWQAGWGDIGMTSPCGNVPYGELGGGSFVEGNAWYACRTKSTQSLDKASFQYFCYQCIGQIVADQFQGSWQPVEDGSYNFWRRYTNKNPWPVQIEDVVIPDRYYQQRMERQRRVYSWVKDQNKLLWEFIGQQTFLVSRNPFKALGAFVVRVNAYETATQSFNRYDQVTGNLVSTKFIRVPTDVVDMLASPDWDRSLLLSAMLTWSVEDPGNPTESYKHMFFRKKAQLKNDNGGANFTFRGTYTGPKLSTPVDITISEDEVVDRDTYQEILRLTGTLNGAVTNQTAESMIGVPFYAGYLIEFFQNAVGGGPIQAPGAP